MNKIVLFACFVGSIGLAGLASQESGKEQQDPPVVSILFFENLTENPDHQWMSRSLSDGLTATLKSGPLVLVERENLEDVIEEQKLSLSGLTDEDTALEVGRILNTSQLIRGGYVVQQDTLRITAKITDTTTGEILYSTSLESRADGYFNLERALAERLAEHYGFSLSQRQGHETGSLDALARYYDGLILLDSQSYDKAAEAFLLSLRKDPSFLKPRESLEESYRFLKEFRKARYQREINLLYKRLANLIERAEAETYLNYGDWVARKMAEGMTAQDISAYTQEHPEVTWGNSRVETWWHAQTVMMEIADYAEEYFQDGTEAERMREQVIAVSRKIQTERPDDPFLAELIYQELLAWWYMEKWTQVNQLSESLMMEWPDYRMMWAIENFYEESLENLP